MVSCEVPLGTTYEAPSFPSRHPHLLRTLPRQRLDTIGHILERLLILLRRISRRLCPLNLLSIIPLDLKSRQYDPSIQAVDVLIGISGESLQLAYKG